MLDRLPTLGQMRSQPRCCPKGQTRLETKSARDKADARKLQQWRMAVWIRDGGKDRYTGRKVKRTIALVPDRGETHHIEPRENEATRYDVRNGILLSAETHAKITAHKLQILGTHWFVVKGHRHINASGAVIFREIP